MTITRLKTVGWWALPLDDLTKVGSTLGGRRVITGMLTGDDEPAATTPATTTTTTTSTPQVDHVTATKRTAR